MLCQFMSAMPDARWGPRAGRRERSLKHEERLWCFSVYQRNFEKNKDLHFSVSHFLGGWAFKVIGGLHQSGLSLLPFPPLTQEILAHAARRGETEADVVVCVTIYRAKGRLRLLSARSPCAV